MTTLPSTSPRSVPTPIAGPLRRLRRATRVWLAVHGLARWLLWLVMLMAADLLVDWFFHMDRAQRGLSLALIAVTLAVVALGRVIRPMTRRLDDDALCRRVEDRHAGLGQRVISAVQLARLGDAEALGVSPAMVAATIQQGAQAAGSVDFSAALDRTVFRRNLFMVTLMLAVLAAAGVAVAATEPMAIWFNRNVLLGDRLWPQDTHLAIKGLTPDGRVIIPRGDDWTQNVEASGVVPAVVEIDYQMLAGGPRLTQTMTLLGDRTFAATFRNVLEPFRFRVRGGDARTGWIKTDLVDRPQVDALTLVLTPPAYLGDQPETLEAGKSPYYALKGSSLAISAQANKPLASAKLRVGDRLIPMRITDGTPGETASAADAKSGGARTQFTARVTPDALAGGTYGIELVAMDGLASRRPMRFAVRIKPDRAPVVKASLLGIGGMIVPQARIPVDCQIHDDFAVTDARLSYQWRGEGEDQPAGQGALRFDDLAEKFGQASLPYVYNFEVSALKLPVGSSLSFGVEAVDNDAVSGPNTGASAPFYVRVVTEQELRDDLLRREQEQRQEFERLIKSQEDLLADSRAMLATIQNAGAVSESQRQALSRGQKQQNLASDRCTAIAVQFAQIRLEVVNNRLDDAEGAMQQRLSTNVIQPLTALAQGPIPRAAELLDLARKAPDPAARTKALEAAADEQQRIALAMREILKHMVKWEGYQEAVNLAYEIFKAQDDVNKETIANLRKQLENIFGDDKPGKDQPPKKDQTPGKP